MNYKEEVNQTEAQRTRYLESIERLIKNRQNEFDEERCEYAKTIIRDSDKARTDFYEMLGFPMTEKALPPRSVKKHLLSEEDSACIYRMEFEIFEDFWFTGLYFEHTGEKLPFVISQHGGLGTPELCSGLYESGTSNYNRMTERIFERGVNVFAPQLLIWDSDWVGVKFDRRDIDSKLKQLGGSITALEVSCLRSVISYFEALPEIDGDKIGMAGLSYGGFYTLFTTAADTRIKAALSGAFFNDLYKYSHSDYTWKNQAKRFLESEIALLCYPRRLWLSVGSDDEVFDIETSKTEYARLLKELELCGIGDEWLKFEIFDGKHEFCPNDSGMLDEMISVLKNG